MNLLLAIQAISFINTLVSLFFFSAYAVAKTVEIIAHIRGGNPFSIKGAVFNKFAVYLIGLVGFYWIFTLVH